MSGFSSAWLDLREPADRAARAPETRAACAAYFADAAELVVCDLGAGAGASVTAFADILPARRRWRLVDADAGLLAEATRRHGGAAIETRAVDLAASPDPWPEDCGLVTATALFDLANAQWIERFVSALADARLPLLATLTYDGRHILAPSHPDDAAMHAAFDQHQRTDKGLGGPAAGPDATAVLVDALERRGYRVLSADSPWRLGPPDRALIDELLRGWADTVAAAGFVPQAVARNWLKARLANTATLTVGHTDVFATPP